MTKRKKQGNVFQQMRRAEAQSREDFRGSSEARNTYNRRQLPGGDMYGMTAEQRGRRTWEETQGLTREAPASVPRASSMVDSVPDQPAIPTSRLTAPNVTAEDIASRYRVWTDKSSGEPVEVYEYWDIEDATGIGKWKTIKKAEYDQAIAAATAMFNKTYK